MRIANSKLVCSNTEPCDWRALDLNAAGVGYEQIAYLECLVGGFLPNVVDRYLGLFIIRLNENMEIQPEFPHDILVSVWSKKEQGTTLNDSFRNGIRFRGNTDRNFTPWLHSSSTFTDIDYNEDRYIFSRRYLQEHPTLVQ